MFETTRLDRIMSDSSKKKVRMWSEAENAAIEAIVAKFMNRGQVMWGWIRDKGFDELWREQGADLPLRTLQQGGGVEKHRGRRHAAWPGSF